MGLVYESITLKNAGDVSSVRRGFIDEPEIRQISVRAMVDTGTEVLIISDDIRQALGLEILGEQPATLANGVVQVCQYTDGLEVHWRDRYTFTHAVVLPEATEVLLGAIPLEGLNVVVDPGNHQLVGAYGDKVMFRI